MEQNLIIPQIDDVDLYINQEELIRLTEPLNSDNPDCFGENGDSNPKKRKQQELFYVDPKPHMSTKFFTFSKSSHDLMIDCIVAGRAATAEEIRAAVPATVLDAWRSVWKDRSEKTGLVSSWKRIQERMNVRVDSEKGNKFLYYRSKSCLLVAYIEQWQEIVMKFHCEGGSRHLGEKDTFERVKKVWMVNVKFYGIPESFIRFCVNNCPTCCDSSSRLAPISKRVKFKYTDSCEVPVKEVQTKLLELALEYKAVLCVKQKYVRYSPFAAEVKDYVCQRAGEPMSNDMQDSRKESLMSKRCGCSFRIRVIVPVLKFNDNRTYVYKDDGVAVFRLYLVHSGHEPGDKDGLLMFQDVGYLMGEENQERFGHPATLFGNLKHSLLSQLKEMKSKIKLLEGNVEKMSVDMLASAARAAFEALNKFRSLEEHGLKPVESIEDNGNGVGQTLGSVAS